MKKTVLSLALLCATYVAAFAQGSDFLQIKSGITLGFQTGVQINRSPILNIPKYQSANRVLIRKKLTHHFDVETGINYTVVPMGYSLTGESAISKFRNQPNCMSIPLTIQYNFLPEHSRLRPYISAGGIYDIIKTSYPARAIVYSDGGTGQVQNSTRYIGLMVAQGVIYEVNTKIQFNENIHFIQESKCKSIGFDIGFGYNL